jgi:hypothetical protein
MVDPADSVAEPDSAWRRLTGGFVGFATFRGGMRAMPCAETTTLCRVESAERKNRGLVPPTTLGVKFSFN